MPSVAMKTDKIHRKNTSVNFGGVKVIFDNNCLTDVPERHVELLTKKGLTVADEADQKRFTDLIKRIEKEANEVKKPAIDLFDENKALKQTIVSLEDQLKFSIEENEKLKDLIEKNETVSVSDDEAVKRLHADIDAMSLEQLKESCEEGNYPKKEWEKKQEPGLKTYLKSKIK